MHAFSDLVAATYCPRQAYYRQADDSDPPPEVEEYRTLAFHYPELLDATDEELASLPIEVAPDTYRSRLSAHRDRHDDWDAIADPPVRETYLRGRECHGIVHKVFDADGPTPSMVSTGCPPERGVWEPDSVRVVAAAKALAYEVERPVERGFVEYPLAGDIRTVRMTTRRKALYRRAVEILDGLERDEIPSRINDRDRCETCDYVAECGVRTRSLRSLLSLP